MELGELRDWLWTENDEQQADVLLTVYQRLNQAIPATGVLPARVRVMTMHSAKAALGSGGVYTRARRAHLSRPVAVAICRGSY
jgi:hypothetical protein